MFNYYTYLSYLPIQLSDDHNNNKTLTVDADRHYVPMNSNNDIRRGTTLSELFAKETKASL